MANAYRDGNIKNNQLKRITQGRDLSITTIHYICYITATSTDPSSSSTITSNFQEAIVIENASKSIGIEAFATVETENGKLGMNIYEGLVCDIIMIIFFWIYRD